MGPWPRDADVNVDGGDGGGLAPLLIDLHLDAVKDVLHLYQLFKDGAAGENTLRLGVHTPPQAVIINYVVPN